ncbi:MAG: HigA family addiction module antidote protein [Prolixibacteraceae bacterium]|nr:HigA family addiction module antidote protein [Prolixibacteraceae bacterium]
MDATANKMTPLRPTHPGEILKDEIEYRGISQRKLAAKIGVSHTLLNEILNAKRPVNTEFALLIEAALGVDPDTLVNMQTRYNMQIARADKTLTERFNQIRKLSAIL